MTRPAPLTLGALTLAALLPAALLPTATASAVRPAQLAGTAQAAQSLPPTDLAVSAEATRAHLADAALELDFDPAAATRLTRQARQDAAPLLSALNAADPASARAVSAALTRAETAARQQDPAALARARADAWTALLRGSLRALERAVLAADAPAARQWLAVREYRVASSLTRLNADATAAAEALAAGTLAPQAALSAIRSDLLDAYQARLNDALRDLQLSQQRGFRTLAAEQQALAAGYFRILAPAYAGQRGQAATQSLQADLNALPGSLARVTQQLGDFRAAPLSARDIRARASQVTRFLSLVPVEYARGVNETGPAPTVQREVEINEARTFLSGAQSALADLTPLLPATQARTLTGDLNTLAADLSQTALNAHVPGAADVQRRVDTQLTALRAAFPADWQRAEPGADLDVIRRQLDAVVAAAAAHDWTAAETARLDAYALLESGTEARIAVFNPDLKTRLEDLLWNGHAPRGLAELIRARADDRAFQTTRAALQTTLADVARILGTEVAPAAVATNAGIIVFREGLEAVLILAALMGSLRRQDVRHLRRPMWLGAAGAFAATAATWYALQGALGLLGRYGEKLEAVVSLIAIGVLLLIMNWFFHQVYWTDRMAAFQKHKHELTRGPGSAALRVQWWGLAVLGFTSVYREGFETVLFLQSLALQAGAATVLSGTAVGLGSVLAIGAAVFRLQAKLPMKKLLVWTGMLICAVLGVMVGNTVHTLQLVGWLPVHPLPVTLPASLGLWLGLHGTWEGVALQAASVTAVIGSFFAAEAIKERDLNRRRAGHAPANT
ncbi:iron permease [Deinococcus seoulensis]|uniref:Iron permease n=1 Tax=Deinococcus seoulensis TaxID=1837379 RepID=A0ABQ2RRP1_9DEIO|nr:FTR1 family protein [Deinococcus seoulensis]GGR60526.1 iron permease [Deinococcus seoulensis]